jgi:diamine N-acetyltransferase
VGSLALISHLPLGWFLSEEDTMTVTLRPVTQENWRAVARLEVAEDQRQFVAPNIYSLAEAAYEPGLTPVAIYADETLIGFALYTHEPFQGDWTFTKVPYRGELGIMRMMVEAHSQQQGYGRQAMQALIERMRRLPGGTAIILNFLPANVAARRFYERLGFAVYEESEDDCWARLEVPAPSSTSAPIGTEWT